MVKILDCTTRDGGHTNNWNFEDQYVKKLIKELNSLGVTYYEIGYRNHLDNEGKGTFYKCTPELLKSYTENKNNLQIGVMTDLKRILEDDFKGADKDYLDFIRIACHPDKIQETLTVAENLHSKGYRIFIQLMDVSNISAEGYIHLFQWKHKDILESLYFADSYGQLTPDDIEKYYNKLKVIGFEKISFHGHNNANTALENSLRAIKLGAYSVDVTTDGIGRCGGNLSRSELFKHL